MALIRSLIKTLTGKHICPLTSQESSDGGAHQQPGNSPIVDRAGNHLITRSGDHIIAR